MMRFSFFFFLLFLNSVFSQDKPINKAINDSTLKEKKAINSNHKTIAIKKDKKEITITDYKIISHQSDTSYFDTTLTIQKDYHHNYLRKDNFELLPFSNLGQPYTTLAHSFTSTNIYPQLGAKAKHFNYVEVEDINYYHVPTPITDLFFKTAMEQGQLLDAFITLNTSEQFNFSLAYKGLRSLGKYQHLLSSTGNFRFTANYHTQNKKYRLKAHIVAQDVLNQENGGIVDETDFESGSSQFKDRSRITVNFENAETLLKGKRYYLEHQLKLLQKNDSLSKYSLALGHQFSYETKFYQFYQTVADDYFGDAFQSANLNDRAKLRTLQNQLYISYNAKTIGNLKLKALHYHYNYFFKSIIYTDDGVISNQLKDNEYALGGEWRHKIAGIQLSATMLTTLSGKLGGSLFNATATYSIDEDKKLQAEILLSERMPNFNFLLYHSDYAAYNWQHTENFNSEKVRQLHFAFLSKKWITATLYFSVLDNHAYFAPMLGQVAPSQYTSTINYLKVKLEKEITFGKFALNNTLLYQNVNQEDAIINVPQLITRNTIYYSNYVFKKALYIQTGLTVKYFTAYNADAYNPLLGEFYVQNQREIGNFPLLDFFINAKVKQTRIYLKAEHFNAPFTGYNFYSAPNYPYRDFIVRFGLVWNFFL